MQGLLDFTDSIPFHTSCCDVGLGKFDPLIKKEEANGVIVSCHNPLGQNIITCKHPYKDEFIEEVNGLDFNIKFTTSIGDVPYYIPVLDLASSNLRGVPFSFPFVGITLKDILSHGGARQIAGSYHEEDNIIFRKDILLAEAFKNKKVILFLTGTDTLIESIWRERDVCDLFETIKGMGFWAVGGINFSVIKGECAFAHALNLKRSLYSASLLEKHGIQTIPHIYAINQFQINRWIKWFIANPQIQLFTINCQLQKSNKDISDVITVVKMILRRVSYLHVLLQGFPLTEMYQFGSLLDRIHLADKTPIKFAHMRRQILVNQAQGKLYDLKKSQKSKRELMIGNINVRYSFLESLRRKVLKREKNKQNIN